MEKKWYVGKGTEQLGPFSEAELKTLVAGGDVTPDTKVWKEGMGAWETAGSQLPGLFGGAPKIPDLGTVAKNMAATSGKVAKAGQKMMSRISEFADKVGGIAGEAVSYDKDLPADAQQPAIFLRDLYFGGRRNIGTALSQLKTLGGMIMSALLSFLYIGVILYLSLSSWQFLPYFKTELVRITLRQKLRWEKLLPILIGWTITMAAGGLICAFWAALLSKATELINPSPGGIIGSVLVFLGSFSIWVFLGFYVFANLAACKKVANLTAHTRSCIILDYGFPNKTRLLMGVSDAPVEAQIESVLALCDAISKANFAPLEMLGANRNFGLRTYLASLIRRFTGQ